MSSGTQNPPIQQGGGGGGGGAKEHPHPSHTHTTSPRTPTPHPLLRRPFVYCLPNLSALVFASCNIMIFNSQLQLICALIINNIISHLLLCSQWDCVYIELKKIFIYIYDIYIYLPIKTHYLLTIS